MTPRFLAEKVGLTLASVALFLSPFIVFLALPPFHIGVWFQSEPVIAGLHAVALCSLSGVIILLLADFRRYFQIILHPFILCCALLGLWSIAVSPFADVPVLSWLGDPSHGEGAIWYFDLASLIAGAMILYDVPSLRRILGIVFASAACIVTALTIYGTHFNAFFQWSPYWFPDYLAFYGIYTAFILISWFQPNSNISRTICIVIGLGIVLSSSNRTAIALCVTLAPVTWLVLYYLQKKAKQVRIAAAAFIIIIPVVLTIGITVYGMYLSRNHPKGWIRSDSLSSRFFQNQIIYESLMDKPLLLITGHGWGHYADHLLAYANLDSVPLAADDADRLDSLDREYFHSHNGFGETLLSTGIIGLGMIWIMLIALPFSCRDSDIPLAGMSGALIAGLFSTWFQLPGSVPFMALAFAGFRQSGNMPAYRWRLPLNITAIMFITVMFLAQSYALVCTLHQGIKVRNTVLLRIPPAQSDSPAALTDVINYSGPGGVHFTRTFLKLTLDEKKKQFIITKNDIPPLFTFLEAHERLLSSGRKMSLRFYNSGLLVRGELAFSLTQPAFNRNAPVYLSNWEVRLRSFLDRAPRRTDMAALYLLWLLKTKEEAKMLRFADWILEKNSNDPVGLWFSGIALTANPEQRHIGIQRLKQSFDSGIERILPIKPEIRNIITTQQP